MAYFAKEVGKKATFGAAAITRTAKHPLMTNEAHRILPPAPNVIKDICEGIKEVGARFGVAAIIRIVEQFLTILKVSLKLSRQKGALTVQHNEFLGCIP